MIAAYLALIFLAFAGFGIAFFIRIKKEGGGCDPVICSNYSEFLGIPNELLGVIYYILIAGGYGLLLVFPQLMIPPIVFGLIVLSSLALLFSLYLFFVQALILKKWCRWCLLALALNVLIFAVVVLSSDFNFVAFLEQYHRTITSFHILGVALGVGGATITDIFFFSFLKDWRISRKEADILHTLSKVIWLALAILIITGIGLYLPEAERLNASPKFLAKLVIVTTILINGVLLNLWISPRLVKISFKQKHDREPGELLRLRKLAFSLGAISIVSWYSVFILGMLRASPAGFWVIIGIYILILVAAVAVSNFIERYLWRR